MMRPLPAFLFLVAAMSGMAQIPYGNEWIDYGRQYWRFKIVNDGIYRIDSTALANAGFPVASVDPADLMLFGRDQQVPIYVQDGGDGVLNTGDFIEFHGQRNDGWLDALMYASPNHQANPYYSLYNDTIRYFLTWDASTPKKRIAPYNNTAFDDFVPRPWFWGETVEQRLQFYWLGTVDQLGVTSSNMIEGETWGGIPLNTTADNGVTQQDIPLATPGAYTQPDAPNAKVFTVVASQTYPGNNAFDDHHLEVYYNTDVLAVDTIFRSVRVVRSNFEVPPSAVAPGSLPIRLRVPHDLFGPGQVGTANPAYIDRQVPSNVRVRYARNFNVLGADRIRMDLPDDPQDGPSRIDITAFTGQPILYVHGDSVRRVLPTADAGVFKAIVPADPAMDETRIQAYGEQTVQYVSALEPVAGDGYFTDIEALEEDSALVIVTHASLMEGAEAYRTYRETNAYNTYNTVIVDVDELYDQFGGGIPKHAFAIRRFAKFMLDHWSTDPQGLFLIGKSVQTPSLNIYSAGIRPDIAGGYANCLVPTYGYPSSDPCFTMGLRFDPRKVEIPVGRLSAKTNDDVFNYLAKVMSSEAQPAASWMKNILHFRGGFTETENQVFGLYLDAYKAIAQDTSFGGNVVTFVRSTSEVFEQASADSVNYFIEDPEQGVTLMTFFAHAYGSGFNITIDNPENYDWQGKHPMVIGNSCYIGNMHQNTALSTGEEWVLMPDKGPIAFLASVDVGITNYLYVYTREFYRSFGQVNYGGSIGRHMQYAGMEQLTNIGDIRALNNVQTFTLQGDPMLILNSPAEPDYAIRLQDILYDPEIVSADVDTFTVKAVVSNIGKAVNTPINVALDRSNPGMTPSTTNFLTTLPGVLYRDTAEFSVPTQGFGGGQGVNSLQVRVDLDPDLVPELDDQGNNVVNTSLFITSGDLVPAYPYDYAIVPDPTPMLKASTGDPLAPPRTYVFQIDTTDLFNSPIRESTSITAPGGVVTWQPQAIYAINNVQDSTVFFWRCSIDSTGNGSYNWYERSFQYIPNKRGWGQAHYFQFKRDDYQGIVYDRPEREYEFFSGLKSIRANVAGNVVNNETEWVLDLVPQEYNGCGGLPAWQVAVVDPSTFLPWGTQWTNSSGFTYNPDNNFGNINNGSSCRNRVENVFTFRTSLASNMLGLQDMIENRIPDGHHVLFYTWLYLDKNGMENNAPGLIPAMEALGVPDFDALQDSVPYIFYVRKGYPGTFIDTIGTAINSTISLNAWIEGAFDQGTITSVVAGPAVEWQGMYWNEIPRNVNDSTRIKVYGLVPGAPDQLLLDLHSALDSLPDLGAEIDAAQYPRLRIQGQFFDQVSPDPEPAQIQRWQLLHVPVPECAIDPPLGYYNALNDLREGNDASVAVAVHNISEFDMDSLLIGAWVVDRNNVRHPIHYRVNAPLPAGAFVIDTVHFSTMGYGGANTLIIEANPIDTATGDYHQLEQYRFNNIAQIRFEVIEDVENPLLDVTFDGMRIMDGDVVSARPEIVVTLKDENPLLLFDSPGDTAVFKVFLTPPGGPIQRIFFRDGLGNENMEFVMADGPDNTAKIIYRPTFNTDGTYQLTVQASDLSNNHSGDNDHKISFEVINRPTITEVLNYPNPFTTSTRFVFTVTGSEPPTYMKIQIMTVTGRVIREVKMHELGPIRVGRNMTEFAWDGTDEFGDKLARGVYLYRVIAQLNGQDIEYRSTGASEYFHKGFGKMYLLR